jgi:6-phosphogluconolactonase (cycloisomerase 2 family)
MGLRGGAVACNGLLIAIVGALLGSSSALAAAPPSGTPVQLSPPNSCYATTAAGGCSAFGGSFTIDGAEPIAISPDGRDVYAAGSNHGSGVAFTRGSSGALAAFGSTSGFASAAYAVDGTALFEGVRDSGNDNGGVASFVRGADGGLTSAGKTLDSCPISSPCATDNGLYDVEGVAVAPGGAYVYAASNGGGGSGGGALTALRRDPSTQSLTELQCVPQTPTATGICSGGSGTQGLGGARGLVVSPDGEFLYATGYLDDSVLGFNLIQSGPNAGQIGSEVNCLWGSATISCVQAPGLGGAGAIALSPDGADAYVASSNGIAALRRDAVSGVLTFNQCFTSGGGGGCAADPSIVSNGRDVKVSPDGRFVYLSGGSGTDGYLRTYARNPGTGTLTPLGCVSYLGGPGCGTAAGLANAEHIALSPDGANLYLSAFQGGDNNGAVAAFRIQSAPVCHGASVTVTAGATVSLPLGCTDAGGDPISRVITAAPTNGTLGMIDQSAGTVAYTASAGAAGADTLSFAASDGTNASAPAAVSITITPAPTAAGGRPPSGTPPGATTPKLSRVTLTNRRFRVARGVTKGAGPTIRRARRTPQGTVFLFTLSTTATIRIQVTHSAPGLRRGRRCTEPSSKLRRAHARRCTRTIVDGALTRSGEPARGDRLAFSGRIGHRALAPSTYLATITASDSAGASAPAKVRFSVLR